VIKDSFDQSFILRAPVAEYASLRLGARRKEEGRIRLDRDSILALQTLNRVLEVRRGHRVQVLSLVPRREIYRYTYRCTIKMAAQESRL
jgi:hypothetical protein